MPRLITGLDAARIHANLERMREDIADAGRDPAEVEILAAVKYVALEEIGVLGEAGLTLLGENRAQELEAKATRAPRVPLALHRPAAVAQGQAILPHVELIHSVASESALRAAGAPRRAGHADPARGQRRGRGRARRGSTRPSCRATSRLPRSASTGLMTMPPFAAIPRPAAGISPGCASSPPSTV